MDLGVAAAEQRLAHRGLVREDALREGFVDEAHEGGALPVLGVHEAAFAQRDAQHLEGVIAHDVEVGERSFGERQYLVPEDRVRRDR